MIVRSDRLGPQRVSEKDIIVFPDGVLGFEALKRYVLLAPKGGDSNVRVLQALDDPAVSFIVVDPKTLLPDYAPRLQDPDREALGGLDEDQEGELEWLAILTVREQLEDMTVNLMAPIVIRKNPRLGRQVVQVDGQYSVRERVWDLVRRLSGGAEPVAGPAPAHVGTGEDQAASGAPVPMRKTAGE